ncbi:hypothetical protein ABID47_004169 [Paenibacillus favisporus]|uniref:Uncharacterized protein n=1 Tax=Paenibacillus favisporus TaxID=221028 RepID=A0ABV2F735_9BACL
MAAFLFYMKPYSGEVLRTILQDAYAPSKCKGNIHIVDILRLEGNINIRRAILGGCIDSCP